jgi:transcriptional regulator with XRE-family HTH domain
MGTYRAKPPVAAWIAQERRRQGWKAGDLAERLATIGVQVSEQTIRVWESNADRKPSPGNLDALERLFGSQAPERPAGDDNAVAAAIDRQTEVLRELIELLRSDREASQAVRERVAAIEAYAEEHERRLQADRQLMGLARGEDPPTRSPLPAASRS